MALKSEISVCSINIQFEVNNFFIVSHGFGDMLWTKNKQEHDFVIKVCKGRIMPHTFCTSHRYLN